MSLLIGDNLVVKINYTLTDEEGTVIDSSEGHEPLAYLHGASNIIPGLEQALVGKTIGDALHVDVEPAEAYGEINPALISVVPMSAFQGVESVEPGMAFQADGPEGPMHVTVRAVEGEDVTVDANHPLAGMKLTFAVEVVDIREATQEEIDHGHVH